MKGKRFRRIQNGHIYEVIGRDETPGREPQWILWNDQIGEREFAPDMRLNRQLGWEVVGSSNSQGSAAQAVPPPLIKKTGSE